MNKLARVLAAALLGGTLATRAAEPARDVLAEGFANPPADARPLVFWQWVNGNVTQEGIRLDLEWMKRIGLAGAILFDVGFRTPPVPQYVDQRIAFGTPAWEKAMAFAASEAKRLGLSLGAQTGGGWSVSGDPGIQPAQAMKKLVWSETLVTPESPATLRLPAPPSVSGPFQDLPVDNPQFAEPRASGEVAVIAFRLPEGETSTAVATTFTPDANGEARIVIRLAAPPRALTLGRPARGSWPAGLVESSRDGVNFRTVVKLPGPAAQPSPVTTYSLGASDATWWRIRFTGLTEPLTLTEAHFDSAARIDRWQEKAGFGVLKEPGRAETAGVGAAIDREQVVDLSSRTAPDGALSWRPREGQWSVLRFGWSLTGRRNVPATPESTGLEVDKLDAAAVRAFADLHFSRQQHALAGGHFDISLTDSWEAGQQNWTPRLFEEFSTRRGYDLRPWMPVLTGRVVTDVAHSERVLADFRRTLADLITDNHYGVLADAAHRRDQRYFAQAAGTDAPTLIDGIAAKGRVDVPTGEYWYWPENTAPNPLHIADVREAASAAHLYGKPLVAAESLTTRGEAAWAQGPAQWRRMADRFFAEGVNRVILHTSAHQPFTDRKPGITLRQYGQHFTRNETWAEDAGAWVDYLARTSWLLQQGKPRADLAIYLGEDPPVTPPFDDPNQLYRTVGFDYDYFNADMLLASTVREGELVAPSGTRYRALVIAPQVRHMSLPVLEKLRAIEDAGVLLFKGRQPLPLGIGDDDTRFNEVARTVWARKRHMFERAIAAGLLPPDVIDDFQAPLHWTHRALPGAEVYFVSNPSRQRIERKVSFRVTGRHAEIWNAEDGSRSPASYREETLRGMRYTAVSLALEPHTSRFVVFRGMAHGSGEKPDPRSEELVTLAKGWRVEFLDGRGAPPLSTFDAGMSWTGSADAAIRFYSGRARYSRTLDVRPEWLDAGRRIELDLGVVGEMARVHVNGRDLGAWWSPPYRHDITDALRAGQNVLEITITNYWANRLIGDEHTGAKPTTFAPIRPYQADSPLRPSGLLGPVRLIGIEEKRNP